MYDAFAVTIIQKGRRLHISPAGLAGSRSPERQAVRVIRSRVVQPQVYLHSYCQGKQTLRAVLLDDRLATRQ